MFALVCIIVPPFLALAIPAGILYCALLSYYRRTSRAMQRIEAVQRAPAYALLSEALAGVAPLRSAHLIRKYVKAMARRVDRRSAVLYHLMSANCWLCLSMEALSSAIVAFAAFASVGFAISGSLTAGAAGLVVTNAIMVTGLLAGGVRAPVASLHGVGAYASDAHALFCEGVLGVAPRDHALRWWYAWAIERREGERRQAAERRRMMNERGGAERTDRF